MTSENGTPLELRRLWGMSEPSRLGRPAELDVRRVVDAAVALADRDGLAGVTLPKVAAALGFTPMSLYRYVGSKDELLTLMRDAGIGVPPELDIALPWREGLRRWADSERQAYLRRPWLVRVPVSGPPSGPNQIGWMDAALSVLRDTGLDWAAKVGVLMLVSGYVAQSVQLTQDLAEGRAEDVSQATAEREYGRALVELVAPERFPEAAKLFASTLFEAPPPDADADFTFGLEVILDGVAAAVRRAEGR
jgi:AcrR family transcriptional regulator